MPIFTEPIMKALHQRVQAEIGDIVELDTVTPDQYFWQLCESIISQQLAEKVASTINARAREMLADDTTPAHVLETPLEEFRAVGLSWAKAKYLHSIAEAWQTGLIDPTKLNDLSDEELIKTLVQIKGVGRWTAEMFLMFTLQRPDIFSVGDYGLRRAIEIHYHLPTNTAPKELAALAEQWQPHRTLASRVLWRSLNLGHKSDQ